MVAKFPECHDGGDINCSDHNCDAGFLRKKGIAWIVWTSETTGAREFIFTCKLFEGLERTPTDPLQKNP